MRKQREVKEFENVKEIIYNSAKEYSNNVAFIKKEQINKKAEYTNITYKELLNQINYYGTKLYDMGLKNKRIAIVGADSWGGCVCAGAAGDGERHGSNDR